MIRFFTGLAVGIYFFTKIDILIWQRIFEANGLWELGIGPYHQGWTYALYGFMAMGFIFFFPHYRRMITFPLSLVLLAFSGLEDVLYYWLDGRAIPALLPWLDSNPLILKPVTTTNLLLSAVIWIAVVVLLELAGERLDRKISQGKVQVKFKPAISLSALLPWIAGKKEEGSADLIPAIKSQILRTDLQNIGIEKKPVSGTESGG